MAKKIVIANWKMNPEKMEEAKKLLLATRKMAKGLRKTSVVVCPPDIYLGAVSNLLKKEKLMLGAQGVFWKNKGSHTGKTSPQMLRSLGVKYVILGHSEQRALGETDEDVAKKTKAVLEAGLTAVVCVGESERDEDGKYLSFLENQISNSLSGIGKKISKRLIVAYEPIWAIGKKANSAVSPDDLHQMSIFVKKVFVKMYDKKTGLGMKVIYGGSVRPSNATSLITDSMIDGFLVGGASLSADDFKKILESVESSK